MSVSEIAQETREKLQALAASIQVDALALAERKRVHRSLGAEIAQRETKLEADKITLIKLSGTAEALDYVAQMQAPEPVAEE